MIKLDNSQPYLGTTHTWLFKNMVQEVDKQTSKRNSTSYNISICEHSRSQKLLMVCILLPRIWSRFLSDGSLFSLRRRYLLSFPSLVCRFGSEFVCPWFQEFRTIDCTDFIYLLIITLRYKNLLEGHLQDIYWCYPDHYVETSLDVSYEKMRRH